MKYIIYCLILISITVQAKPESENSAKSDIAVLLENVSEKVSTIQIWQAYQINEVRADARFSGKSIALTGNVSKVVKAIDGTPIIRFNMDEFGVNHVDAYLNKNQLCDMPDGNISQCNSIDIAEELQLLQAVNLVCLGAGSLQGNPNFVQCMLVPRSWTK